jgi:hypothetical protein
MFGRLKDFRCIATRYDRLAVDFLAAICRAATVGYWLRVQSLASAIWNGLQHPDFDMEGNEYITILVEIGRGEHQAGATIETRARQSGLQMKRAEPR